MVCKHLLTTFMAHSRERLVLVKTSLFYHVPRSLAVLIVSCLAIGRFQLCSSCTSTVIEKKIDIIGFFTCTRKESDTTGPSSNGLKTGRDTWKPCCLRHRIFAFTRCSMAVQHVVWSCIKFHSCITQETFGGRRANECVGYRNRIRCFL